MSTFVLKYRELFRKSIIVNSLVSKDKLLATFKFSNNAAVTEQEIYAILKKNFPSAKEIVVEDTSGGCGAMFNIHIVSPQFKGLSVMKQHRCVYDALKQQIKSIHGLHVTTKASD